MFKDLDNHQQLLFNHSIVSALAGDHTKLPTPPNDIPLADELDYRVEPKDAYHVLDADSSQQEAIEAAKHGANFVLQGPPGTGKSQTITNIIAELLAQNKTVLFVSEKMAALQVVYNRLQQVGLDEFCLELHSHKTSKKLITQELERCLNGKKETPSTEIDTELESLAEHRQKLNKYVHVLHNPKTKLKMTPFEAYTQLAKETSAPRVSLNIEDATNVTPDLLNEWENILQKIQRHSTQWNQHNNHPWRGIRISNFSFELRNQLDNIFKEIVILLDKIQFRLSELCNVYGLIAPSCISELDKTVNVITTLTPRFWKQEKSQLLEYARRFKKWESSTLRLINPKYWLDIFQGRKWWAQKNLSITEKAQVLQDTLSFLSENNQQPNINHDYNDLIKEIKSNHEKLWKFIKQLEELLEVDTIVPNSTSFKNININELNENIKTLNDKLDELEPWMAYCADIEKAKELGLGSFLEAASSLEVTQLLSAFKRAFYEKWIDSVHKTEPILQNFKGEDHKAIIKRFKELDAKSIQMAPRRKRAALMANRPSGNWLNASSAETAIVHKEAHKKRGHFPIRKLFKQIPGLLPRIKPCLLMSPLTVSQYLDPEIYTCDTVIFDEASQIKPEDAIGSILRANQVIVVGDSKQLPPSNFFDRLVSNDSYQDDEEDIPQFESILNECLGIGLPEKMLTWHYRSRDESLIAFSNYWFYNNALVTFRHADPIKHGFGVDFVYVEDGIYDRSKSRTNRVEAVHTAELVLTHYHETPHNTIGVVAFSEAQQMAILQEIERLRRQYPDFAAWLDSDNGESFFVKNLENVQGDERDTIFVSVGYGKDATGKLSLNFGPLNKDGGERRLNVVVTRAKKKLKLISSIRADDIDLARSNKQGIRLLKDYLLYAEKGIDAFQQSVTVDPSNEPESPFEAQVLEALQNNGLTVDTQVGSSGYRIDLAIKDPKNPGRYILGIECDGTTYHAAKTARDRDRLKQQVLEDLGWNIYRIWSRDWFMHPKREIEKVLNRIAEIQEKESTKNKKAYSSNVNNGYKNYEQFDNIQSKASESQKSVQYKEDQTQSQYPADLKPYKPANIRFKKKSDFYSASIKSIVEIIVMIVEQEGPIKEEMLANRVADAWGLTRAGNRVRQRVNKAVKTACNNKTIVKKIDALQMKNAISIPIRKNNEQHSRDIEQIPMIEILAAVRICLNEAVSIKESELIATVAKIFGFHRAGSKIQKRLVEAINLLESNEEAIKDNDIIRIGKSSIHNVQNNNHETGNLA